MKREAYIAQTPYGASNVNHLRISSFRVLSIKLDNGNTHSKFYFPEGTPLIKSIANNGNDDFHFAPGPQLNADNWQVNASKTDPVKIKYALSNPASSITEGTLELFTRFEESPAWTRTLKGDELKDGDHILKFGESEQWNGRIENADRNSFPVGYITAEHAVYKLKLTLKGEGGSEAPIAWTYFHVLIGKLELAYGNEKMLPLPAPDKPDHRKVLNLLKQQNAQPPAEGSKVKVFLESNIYKRNSNEMFDNTLFTRYETMWGDGAQVPLIVTAWIKNSRDENVLSPFALGKVKFLWDWESRSVATGNTFVDQAMDYYKDSTKPKGLNCHYDRGGKRASNNAAVFPAQSGYPAKDNLDNGKFPFKVEACPDPRKWSAISYAWREKKLAAKTGVIFQPGRMAGDVYSVSVYIAYDISADKKILINTDADAPLPVHASLKLSTGDFEIWRKAHLRQYLKKRDDVTNININDILLNYKSSFIDIEDVSGGPASMTEVEWNNTIRDAISGWADEDQLLIDPITNQYNEGTVGIGLRSLDQFTKASYFLKIKTKLLVFGLNIANSDAISYAGANAIDIPTAENDASLAAAKIGADINTRVSISNVVKNARNDVIKWLTDRKIYNDEDHAYYVENKCIDILVIVFNNQFTNNNDVGIRVFQVTQSTNLIRHQKRGKTLGRAAVFSNASGKQCGFLLMAPDTIDARKITKINAHEIGHHLFLPHPLDTAERRDYKAHDQNVNSCLMSYNINTPMELCGFCQLRLRGWNKNSLNTDGTNNQKT